MASISSDNIFKIFDPPPTQSHHQDTTPHTNYILLKMVVHGVSNYYIQEFSQQSRNQNPSSPIGLSIKLKYFNILLEYLKRIDMSHSETLYELKDIIGESTLHYTFTEMISFYEEIEYYEDCSYLMEFIRLFFPKRSWKPL